MQTLTPFLLLSSHLLLSQVSTSHLCLLNISFLKTHAYRLTRQLVIKRTKKGAECAVLFPVSPVWVLLSVPAPYKDFDVCLPNFNEITNQIRNTHKLHLLHILQEWPSAHRTQQHRSSSSALKSLYHWETLSCCSSGIRQTHPVTI